MGTLARLNEDFPTVRDKVLVGAKVASVMTQYYASGLMDYLTPEVPIPGPPERDPEIRRELAQFIVERELGTAEVQVRKSLELTALTAPQS
jgi:hypothetical protein